LLAKRPPKARRLSNAWRHTKDLVAARWSGLGLCDALVEATIETRAIVGRHKHPGIEFAYVLEGGFELPVLGDGFQNPTRDAQRGW
jgi:hypothetical protein